MMQHDSAVSLDMLQQQRGRKSIFAKHDGSAQLDKHSMVADYLDKIVSRLQRRATINYWTIVVVLSVGVALIVFAGYFSSFDTNLLWSRLDTEWNKIHFPTPPPINSSPVDQENYQYQKTIAENVLQKYWDHYDRLLKVSISGYDEKNVLNWVPIALKVSVAGLLIFLVQILIQLYRYNWSLIVFYSSRRYAIIMSEGDLKATERWEAVFAPVNLEFGRDPRHPFQYVASLFHRGKTPDKGSGSGEGAHTSTERVTPAGAKQAPPAGAETAHEGA